MDFLAHAAVNLVTSILLVLGFDAAGHGISMLKRANPSLGKATVAEVCEELRAREYPPEARAKRGRGVRGNRRRAIDAGRVAHRGPRPRWNEPAP